MKPVLYVILIVGLVIVSAGIFISMYQVNNRQYTAPSEGLTAAEISVPSSPDLSTDAEERKAVATPQVTVTPSATVTPSPEKTKKPESTKTPEPTHTPEPVTETAEDFEHKGKNSPTHFFVADSPYSMVTEVGFTTLINVNHRLSKDYKPKNLVRVEDYVNTDIVQLYFDSTYGNKTAVLAFAEMMNAAYEDGVTGFVLRSSYRSYATQTGLWNKRLSQDKQYGRQKGTPLGSAYPGTSEHQTGLAFDITCTSSVDPTSAFAKTANYRWLRDNSYKYGFILRYAADKTDITGIKYEPYHYRYVGKALAKELHKRGVTLEEYYNCPVVYE